MKLSITERLVLPQLCPERSNLPTMRIVADLLKKVELTKKEKAKCNFKTINDEKGTLSTFDRLPGYLVEIEFTAVERQQLSSFLTRKSQEDGITADMLTLAAKIEEAGRE